MDIGILGPLEVRDDTGRLIPLGRRRMERSVLGLLVLELGRPVTSERLVALLWGDRPPPRARALLSTHVSRLRQPAPRHTDGIPERPGAGLGRRVPVPVTGGEGAETSGGGGEVGTTG